MLGRHRFLPILEQSGAQEQANAGNISGLRSFYRQVQGGISMPTKRRVVLFLIVLAFMVLVYRATAEEPAKPQPMQWRGPNGADSEAIEHAVYILMGGGIVFGGLVGGGRAIANKRRMKKDGYFTGDLTMISLADDSNVADRRKS
jgi:hypothetical protein